MKQNYNCPYSAGLYIRLSTSDEDKKQESQSITNQKSLLLQYVKENNLSVHDIYIDDGFSGTNFERPEFIRLINDIENQKVNMVITKDMSRLGRDYIETGNLLEKYFPRKNVRYIAITDNIDTYLDTTNNDIAPFKAIMNDMYAKDISKKIKSSLKAKQKDGKWTSGRCPFGYDIDPKDKNKLIINKEKASIVKRIFNLSLQGFTFFKIAKLLTEENVKTPASYYNFDWKLNYNVNYNKWNSKTVRDILSNRIYIGDLVQGKRRKVNYKIKKIIKNDPSDYIIVESTHEPIIDRELFYEIQKLIPKNAKRCEKKEEYLLDGLLYCGDCGHRIGITPRRKKDNKCYTVCNYYRTHAKEKLCTMHSNNYDTLEKVIVKNIRQLCKSNVNRDNVKKIIKTQLDFDFNKDLKRELDLLETEIKKLKENMDNLYIDKLNDEISLDTYKRVKTKLEDKLNIKLAKIDELTKSIEFNNKKNKDKLVETFIDNFLLFENIDRLVLVNLINKIEIYENKDIKVNLTFVD